MLSRATSRELMAAQEPSTTVTSRWEAEILRRVAEFEYLAWGAAADLEKTEDELEKIEAERAERAAAQAWVKYFT